VTTGSPTIPKDALNPAILQDDAYYQQFQPTPDKSYQLWTGNLKKYLVTTGGILKDKKGTAIVDADGKIVANYDYWAEETTSSNQSADENTVGSDAFALRGGAWSKLLLRTNPLNNPSNGVVQRKVFTNRIYTNGSFVSKSDELRQVKPTDLTDTNYKNDEYRGYLVRALGYNIDAATPPTSLDNLKTAVEFRQTGAVMHSQPILVTNKGKLEFNESTQTMGSTGREDYVLFGTTQGALHVVKAGTSGIAGGGEEVFTFIPNEMLVKQKQAFEKPEVTSGGTNQLFYGIDGPWTAYTEYVVDGSGYLTVGDGKGDQKGVQNVYGGLRMGGRSYYALDLKDIQNPKLKFHINPDSALAGTPLSYMGQSWSKPTIGFVNWAGKRTRVMFVGGGYDDGYESTSYDQTNKKGAGVYMFSAEDTSIQDGNNTIAIKAGELLWWSSANATTSIASTKSGTVGINSPNMQYSVVSEIRSVDRDGDDLIDHVYFGDLGGQIFRTDFNNKEKTIGSWAKAPILIFDEHKANGKSPRFYDMPAFSLYNNNGSIFAVVSQGSGNRSAPLFADSSYDYDAIYNIYDKDVARTDLYNYDSVKNPLITKNIKVDNVSGLRLINDDKRKDNTDGKGNILYNAPASAHGWYYKFTDCVTGYGKCDSYKQQTEKVFGTPIALNNKLFVSTFDASKDGLAGDCGAGVKGASLMTTFCLPFGQCAAGDVTGTTHTMIGAGIHTVTVGNGNSSGNGGSTGGGTGGVGSKLSSASNYCIATGSRVTITVTGSSGSGEQTRMCLVPQRWYEKL
jgi:Tfp pilus tip-associated adhesin PilY1